MNMAALAESVYARLTGDATLMSLATGGVHNTLGPATGQTTETNSPYVVFQVTAGSPTDAFTADGFLMTVSVLVATLRTAGYTAPSQILERVYGDWSGASAQTHGLHRWRPTLAGTAWLAGEFACTGVRQDEGDDVWLFYLDFEVPVSRTKP